MQGAVLSGAAADATKDMVIIDVTPLTLGIETARRHSRKCGAAVASGVAPPLLWRGAAAR